MSISIYSFITNDSISNAELKTYYDVMQVNEDKLHSKLRKSDMRKLRTLVGKDSLSDEELVTELIQDMRNVKKLVKALDEKIQRCLGYQESIVENYNTQFVKDLVKTIMRDRVTYESYIRQYMKVDILTFERFTKEYNKLLNLKLPFENIQYSDVLQRLGAYERKYHTLEYEVKQLERNYKRILANTRYYDSYNFDYKESNYFSYQGANYGILGWYYYKNDELLPKETFEKVKEELAIELAEKKKEYTTDYDWVLENNYTLANLTLQERKPVGIKRVKRWDSWYLILDKEQIVIYSDKGYINIPKEECAIYEVNEDCKGPVILEIKDVKKLIKMLEEQYRMEILFTMIVGTKQVPGSLLKKKVELQPLDLEGYYNFKDLEEQKQEQGLDIPKEVLEELEGQPEGNYYLTIEQGYVKIRSYTEQKELKIEIEDKEAELKTILVRWEKMIVKFSSDVIKLVVREKELVLTNGREYQLVERVELDESEPEEDQESD